MIADCVDICSQWEHITYDEFKKNICDGQGICGRKSPLDSPKDTLSQDSIKSMKHSTPMIQCKYFNYDWDKIPFKV